MSYRDINLTDCGPWLSPRVASVASNYTNVKVGRLWGFADIDDHFSWNTIHLFDDNIADALCPIIDPIARVNLILFAQTNGTAFLPKTGVYLPFEHLGYSKTIVRVRGAGVTTGSQ